MSRLLHRCTQHKNIIKEFSGRESKGPSRINRTFSKGLLHPYQTQPISNPTHTKPNPTHTKPNPYQVGGGLQIIFEKSVTNRQMDMGRSRGATAPKNVISMWSALQVRLSKTGGD